MEKIKCRFSTAGLTLVELMVAIALGMFVVASITSVMVANLVTNSTNLKMTKLDQELRAIMQIMARDIRRAGYWANAIDDINQNQNNNPFTTNAASVDPREPLKVGSTGAAAVVVENDADLVEDEYTNNNCILFSYDLNDDGSLNADEYFGFRLNDGAVEARDSNTDCDGNGNSWENLTDENAITITALNFTVTSWPKEVVGTALSEAGIDARVAVREVDITLTGQLGIEGGVSVDRTIRETVRIRNDRFYPAT